MILNRLRTAAPAVTVPLLPHTVLNWHIWVPLTPSSVFGLFVFKQIFLQTHQVSRFTSLHRFVTNLWSSCIEMARKSSSIQNWSLPILRLSLHLIYFLFLCICAVLKLQGLFLFLLVVYICRWKERGGREGCCPTWPSMKILAICLERSWSQTSEELFRQAITRSTSQST